MPNGNPPVFGLPCRFPAASSIRPKSRVQDLDRNGLFGSERVRGKFFPCVSLSGREGEGAALLCRLSPFRRCGSHRLGDRGLLLLASCGPANVRQQRWRLAGVGDRFKPVGNGGHPSPGTTQRNMRPCGGRPSSTWPTVSKWIGRPWPCWVPAWMSRRRRSNGFSLKTAVEPAAP